MMDTRYKVSNWAGVYRLANDDERTNTVFSSEAKTTRFQVLNWIRDSLVGLLPSEVDRELGANDDDVDWVGLDWIVVNERWRRYEGMEIDK